MTPEPLASMLRPAETCTGEPSVMSAAKTGLPPASRNSLPARISTIDLAVFTPLSGNCTMPPALVVHVAVWRFDQNVADRLPVVSFGKVVAKIPLPGIVTANALT